MAASPAPDVVSGTGPALHEIPFEAEADVRAALGTMGRTEDVRLSPDGRRLAIACYAQDRVLLAGISLDRMPAGVTVAIEDLREVSSPAFHEPHGVDFVDDDTLIVSNRSAGVTVLRIPDRPGDVVATDAARGAASLEAQGSVAVRLERPADVARDDDTVRRYELHALETVEQHRQATADALHRLHAIQQTKAWRLIEPARRLYRTARRLRPSRP